MGEDRRRNKPVIEGVAGRRDDQVVRSRPAPRIGDVLQLVWRAVVPQRLTRPCYRRAAELLDHHPAIGIGCSHLAFPSSPSRAVLGSATSGHKSNSPPISSPVFRASSSYLVIRLPSGTDHLGYRGAPSTACSGEPGEVDALICSSSARNRLRATCHDPSHRRRAHRRRARTPRGDEATAEDPPVDFGSSSMRMIVSLVWKLYTRPRNRLGHNRMRARWRSRSDPAVTSWTVVPLPAPAARGGRRTRHVPGNAVRNWGSSHPEKSRPPASIGSIRPKIRSRMPPRAHPVQRSHRRPYFAARRTVSAYLGGIHEHLGGDAPHVQARPAEQASSSITATRLAVEVGWSRANCRSRCR